MNYNHEEEIFVVNFGDRTLDPFLNLKNYIPSNVATDFKSLKFIENINLGRGIKQKVLSNSLEIFSDGGEETFAYVNPKFNIFFRYPVSDTQSIFRGLVYVLEVLLKKISNSALCITHIKERVKPYQTLFDKIVSDFHTTHPNKQIIVEHVVNQGALPSKKVSIVNK